MPAKPRALLVELFPSHGFMIAPLVRSLEGAGYEVGLAINSALGDDVAAAGSERDIRFLANKGGNVSFLTRWRLARYIRRQSFDLVVFLTVRTRGVVTLAAMLSGSTRLAGVHHNPDKLWRGRRQARLVRSGFRFLVLSRRSCEIVRQHVPLARVEYLYPGCLESRRLADPESSPPLRIAVPGELALGKRDYRRLVDTVAKSPQTYAGLQFELLGDSSTAEEKTIRGWIHEGGVENLFQTWLHRIPANEYDQRLRHSHAILPLIHGEHAIATRFRTVKTSGAMILAHRYGLPLILEDGFRQADLEYDSQAVFYSEIGLPECLQQLPATLPAATQMLRQALEQDPRLTAKAQQERLASFLAR